MNKRTADMRVLRARASTAPQINHESTLLLTAPAQPLWDGRRNRRAVRLTAAQKNSIGRTSEWNRSPYSPKGGWR